MTRDTLTFTKGHGTQNDFVLLFDERGEIDLSPALVRALCDRRAGIGADGVLRAVRAGFLDAGESLPEDMWFMDYRNADGSVAEMCGNGARVFGAFLEREVGEDLSGGLAIGTRAGERVVTSLGLGRYSVTMGRWEIPGGGTPDASVVVAGLPGARPAVRVDVGNPHTVLDASSVEELEAAKLTEAPQVEPLPADGTNVEIVLLVRDRDAGGAGSGGLSMRVHERGSGETRSCGTGAVAAAAVAHTRSGAERSSVWEVEVPGGILVVRVDERTATLEGPAELIADGVVLLDALERGGRARVAP